MARRRPKQAKRRGFVYYYNIWRDEYKWHKDFNLRLVLFQ